MTTRQERNPEIATHMASFIKARRKSMGLSLDDLASRTQCSKTHLWEMEKGRSKNPTLWMILALCEGLNCSLNSLIGCDVSQPLITDHEMELIDAHRRIFQAKQ